MWRDVLKMPRRLISTISLRYVNMPHERIGACTPPIQVCTMSNGTKLVWTSTPFDDKLTMSSLTVAYHSGSRYEYCDTLGATHLMRLVAAGSGCGSTGFAKSRYFQQWAGVATCTSDRDVIMYTMTCPPPVFKMLKPFFLDACGRTIYDDATIDNLKPRALDDLYLMDPRTRVMDLIQKASFSGALYNSAFCNECRIDDMDSDKMNAFAEENIRPQYCSIACTGIPYDDLMDFADCLTYGERVARSTTCTYHRAGFEFYDLGPKSDTYIAVAVPATGSCDTRRVLIYNILVHALGAGNMIDYGNKDDAWGDLPLSLLSADTKPASISAFNISYSDYGIFGLVAKCDYASAWCMACRMSLCLLNMAAIDAQLFEIGKKRLMMKLAMNEERSVNISEGLALMNLNGLFFDGYNGPESLIRKVQEIPPTEIQAVAKSITNDHRCLSYAVVGDIGACPTDSELRGF